MNWLPVVVGIFLRENRALFSVVAIAFFLSSCASSDVSRNAAANIDLGVQNAKNLASGDTDLAESYQNSSQATKGAIMGGVAGGVTGAVSSIGFLPAAATGAIIGASYGAYIDSTTTLQDRLENRGAVIVVLGDQVLLMLPSTRIFNDNTSEIKPQAYSTLNLVAQFINSFTKTMVKVAAYTNDTGSSRISLALSQQQARHVAKFLTASGVNARMLFAEGYGGTHLIERNSYDGEGSDNYRIEITFEKIDGDQT